MRLEQGHSPAARLTGTRTTVQSHHDDLLHHIGSGLSTPGGCCDVTEPDLSVALDVGRKRSTAFGAWQGGVRLGIRLTLVSIVRNRGAFVEMLVSSVLSLIASFVLAVDAIKLAADPLTELSCNISEKISCASVGLSWQASALGFPNAFLGLIAEPVVITIAVASLAGVVFPRWFMIGAQVFYAIGFGFAYWLFFQAYFVIGALCPWCLLITAATTLVFFSMTRVNIMQGNIRFPGKLQERVVHWLRLGADTWIAVLLLAIIAAMVLVRYV